jgi:hypothetical protein
LQASNCRAVLLPRSKQPSQNDELPEVIGIVIGYQQRLAENRLSLPMGNFGQEIRRGILQQILNRFPVGAKPKPQDPSAGQINYAASA